MSVFSSSPVVVRGLFLMVFAGLVVGTVGCDGGGASSDPPNAPSGVQATSGDGTVSLEWEGASEASGYNLYRDTSSAVRTDGSPVNGDTPVDQTFFADESVDNGTLYYYRVTAVGDGGESEPSAEVEVRPFPAPPDDRP